MFKSDFEIYFNDKAVNNKPTLDDYIFIYKDNNVLTITDLKTPTLRELSTLSLNDFAYLFSFEDKNVFLCNDVIELDKYHTNTLREFLYLTEFRHTSIMFTAYHLKVWYENNKYCGKCGNTFTKSKKERSLFCEKCYHILYPTISPVVIVGIYSEDELLLTKYAKGKYRNYALVAGYVEVGESLEECVSREVFEEVGLKIKNIKYMGSQPWGISQTTIAGFYAEVDGSKEVKLDNNELAEGTWFKRCDLPRNNEGNGSITWALIYNFRNNEDFLNNYENF
ncbi:MAG: NAD(+) diphosphatase [Lachnospirales bacterium]